MNARGLGIIIVVVSRELCEIVLGANTVSHVVAERLSVSFACVWQIKNTTENILWCFERNKLLCSIRKAFEIALFLCVCLCI